MLNDPHEARAQDREGIFAPQLACGLARRERALLQGLAELLHDRRHVAVVRDTTANGISQTLRQVGPVAFIRADEQERRYNCRWGVERSGAT